MVVGLLQEYGMYPQHLIDLAEEAFDVYLSKDPESQQAWEKLVEAVSEHLKDTNSNISVQQYVDDLSAYIMEK